MRAALLAILLGFMLSGCVTTQVRVLETERQVLVELDPSYYKDCEVEAPPTPEAFMAMGTDERESALAKSLAMQYGNRYDCTLDKRSLRELTVKQKRIIDEYNRQEALRVAERKKQLETNHE